MTERVRSVLLVLLLVVSSLSTAGVGAASATTTESKFHVTQAGQCYEVAAYGDGTKTVEDFYDYRKPNNTDPPEYTYSSHGTKDLQKNQASNLFVYYGSDGYSVVLLHDKLDEDDQDGPYGSTITFEFSNMSDVTWEVRDDNYTIDGEPQDDNWDIDGSTHVVDWMWASHRTDGGAFSGIGDEEITIDPQFNDAAAQWGSWKYSGDGDNRTEEWRLLDGDGNVSSLDMQESVTIEKGSCPDTTNPDAALSASPTTVGNDEAVTFDASNSTDDGTIAEFQWDFDGDGTSEKTTESATVSHTYESPGTYDASVTVVDEAGNTDSATATVAVEEPADSAPDAALSVSPEIVAEGGSVALDASNSTDDGTITEYQWDFDGDGKIDANTSDSEVSHTYPNNGSYDASVTVVDDSGQTDTATATVTVESDESPTVMSYQVQSPAKKTVEVSFLGSKSITDIEVGVTDENDSRVATLTEADFETRDAGSYDEYSANLTVESNGTYTATLLTAADADGDDAATGQNDSTIVGPVEGDITYVNGSAVRVNGTFEAVSLTVGFYDSSGYGQSRQIERNVSGTTLVTANDQGSVNGTMINVAAADVDFDDAEAELSEENPRFDYYAERIKPRPVTVSVESVTQVGDGTYEVAFGYDNPNDETLFVSNSTFSGNVSEEAPEEFAPGENTVTATWTPDSDDERAGWTLNRSNFGQSDVTATTPPASEVGDDPSEPGSIEFVNATAVEVTGDFEIVQLKTSFFAEDGVATSTHYYENVSGTTVLTPPDEGVWGPVTSSASALTNESDADPAVSADNPDFQSQLDDVRPDRVSTFVEDATKVDDETYEVTFGYENPNGESMLAGGSEFTAGNTSDEPPTEFAPGRHTFTATWTPESDDSNLVWWTDFSNFGHDASTATSPTLDQIGDDQMPPTAKLTADPTTVAPGETVRFDASDSTDDGTIAEYRWDFDGDGTPEKTTESATVTKSFSETGTQDVVVTVVDESGQSDSATQTVTVREQYTGSPPTAHLSVESPVSMSQVVVFDASDSTDDDAIAEYRWDFDGDGEIDRTTSPSMSVQTAESGPGIVHHYAHKVLGGPGTYEATVTVVDTDGNTDTATRTITVEKNDHTKPSADLDAPNTVEVGEEFTVEATNFTEAPDDLAHLCWLFQTDDGMVEGANGPTTSFTFDETGEKNVTLKLKDRAGNVNEITTTVTVTAAEDDDSNDDSDNSDDSNRGGFTGGDDTDTRTGGIGPADPGNDDSGEQTDDETTSAPLKDADSRVGNVVVTSSVPNADPAVGVTDAAPEGVEAPAVADDGFAALSYLNVTGAEQATFTVSKARLDAASATADAVSLFSYEDGAWTVVETAQVNATDDAYRFRANVSDGTYAVGVGNPVTSVTDVSVGSQNVEQGDTATVSVTVENTGHADATREVELTVGGDVVATKTVSVEAGATTTVTFSRTFDSAGVYEVGVGGETAELAVKATEAQTTTGESESVETTTTDTSNSSNVPGFGVGIALVALLAAAFLALRRQ
ncbi:PKD domain-containing protein [Halorussus salinisoli]|uniref:PKD domain-containing protein n=1 Tax=Halorussus salinisoli TaxID=2558242 RepID=UPI0010C17654|nr:PKD domain-containing protein [Halorussus salinisoli]